MTASQRQVCTVDDHHWQGDAGTKDHITAMLRDWGPALEIPLYQQAVVHFLGGELTAVRQLPMERDGIPLGNQRFHLLDPTGFFRITAFSGPGAACESQLKRLLECSPLRAAHWINITRGKVTFTTVS